MVPAVLATATAYPARSHPRTAPPVPQEATSTPMVLVAPAAKQASSSAGQVAFSAMPLAQAVPELPQTARHAQPAVSGTRITLAPSVQSQASGLTARSVPLATATARTAPLRPPPAPPVLQALFFSATPVAEAARSQASSSTEPTVRNAMPTVKTVRACRLIAPLAMLAATSILMAPVEPALMLDFLLTDHFARCAAARALLV